VGEERVGDASAGDGAPGAGVRGGETEVAGWEGPAKGEEVLVVVSGVLRGSAGVG
jgi:hypothetical protein